MLINFVDYDEHENELYYDESKAAMNNFQQKNETFVEFVDIEIKCLNCNDVFSFRIKLYKHLRDECITNCSKFFTTLEVTAMLVEIETSLESLTRFDIVSLTTSTKDKDFELSFRNWNYVETWVKFKSNFSEDFVCLDTDIEASLVDKKSVQNNAFKSSHSSDDELIEDTKYRRLNTRV